MNKDDFREKKITLVINNIKVKHATELMFYLKILKKNDEKCLESAKDAAVKSELAITNTVSTVGKLKRILRGSCET